MGSYYLNILIKLGRKRLHELESEVGRTHSRVLQCSQWLDKHICKAQRILFDRRINPGGEGVNSSVCDVGLGYCALVLCILTDNPPEVAFKKLSGNLVCIRDTYELGQATTHHGEITQNDIAMMAYMKLSMTYKQIGEYFGISDQAVYQRIKRYRKQKVRQDQFQAS